MRPQVGQLINNKYRLTRMLGDGGMGSVFEAQHEMLGNAVALKFLHPELARRQGLVQRFLQEARVSAKIQSTHVVKVTDVEQTPTGLPFMVMEFLKGKSLQTIYEDNYRDGIRLSYEDALKYSVQMLDGLEAAHEEGVIHRDLKPDNVMIVKGKRSEQIVKLLDFGIAKLKINGELYKGLTRPGVIMGTPEYMAPEQVFSADAVDARADIFSCGVMIFEMLAGRRPVGGDEAHQIAAAYLSGNIARLTDLAPHVSAELAEVIHQSMAADPKDRFGSVADFRTAMEPFTSAVSKPGYTTPPPNATPAVSRVESSSKVEKSAKSEPRSSDAAAVSGDAVVSSAPKAEKSGSAASIEFAGTVSAAKSPDGWAVDGALSSPEGAMTDKMSQPWVGEASSDGASVDKEYAAISAKLKAARNAGAEGDKPAFDSTVEGQPFFPGATAGYEAKAEKVGTMKMVSSPPAAGAVRPGGTDVLGNSTVDGSGTMPVTASYDSKPRAAAYPSGPSAMAAAPRRRRRSSMGFGWILLIGTLVSGAVVAGVYAFDQVGKEKPAKDDTKTIALPAKTSAAAPPVTQTAVVTTPPVQTQPQVVFTNPPATTTTTTGPRPTGKPTGPKPSASTSSTSPFPPILPSAIPGLPSAWPPVDFPFPGLPGQTSTSKPDPKPEPKPEPKPGKPKLEPIPHGELTPATPSKPSETKPADPPKEASLPKFELPKFELPKFEIPGRSTPKETPAASSPKSAKSEKQTKLVPITRTVAKPRR